MKVQSTVIFVAEILRNVFKVQSTVIFVKIINQIIEGRNPPRRANLSSHLKLSHLQKERRRSLASARDDRYVVD